MAFAKRFEGSTQLRELRQTSSVKPLPEVAQIAVVEIVGQIRRDVGGEPNDQVPRLLRPTGHGSGCAQLVAREESADINLARRGANQLVIAITAVEVPFSSEIMVNASHSEVVALGYKHIGLEALFVDAIAARTG